MVKRKAITAAVAVGGVLMSLPTTAAATDPTCAGVVGQVHGHHVVGDYVTGEGHDELAWPPAGQTNAAGGAVNV